MDMWFLLDAEKTKVFLVSSVVWSLLYIAIYFGVRPKLDKLALDDVQTRLVSFVHGLFVICYSTKRVLDGGVVLGVANTEYENIVLTITLAYFLYDTVIMVITNTHDAFIMLHHGMVLAGVYTVLIYDIAAMDMILGFFVAEWSNPSMHIKEMLKTMNLTTTKFFVWNEITFYVLYLIWRNPIGIPVCLSIIASSTSPLLGRVMVAGILLQSMKWSWTIQRILRKRISQIKERKAKGIELAWFTPLQEQEGMKAQKSA